MILKNTKSSILAARNGLGVFGKSSDAIVTVEISAVSIGSVCSIGSTVVTVMDSSNAAVVA